MKMDVFLVLQILFDAVLLFGIFFLFHFSVNQNLKKKEEIDIVKNIQVQEVKENLEKILSSTKQSGKDASEEIQEKINDIEQKVEAFNRNFKKLEKQLNLKLALARESSSGAENIEAMDLPKDKKNILSETNGSERKTIQKNGYSIGFSSTVIKQVYEMMDSNKEIAEVIKATKLTKAEISLILNLRENRFTAPN